MTDDLRPADDGLGRTLIVKLASRCNLYCTYCYWFRDPQVEEQAAVLSAAAAAALPGAIRDHVIAAGLADIAVVFHGGEPLLFRKSRFDALCTTLRASLEGTGCRLFLAITTNAVLVDEEWCELFRRHGVAVTVSFDGPKAIHDAARVTRKGKGSFDQVVEGVRLLQQASIPVSILSVANLKAPPAQFISAVVEDLGIDAFDVLFPDLTHDDEYVAIGDYYAELFDEWFDHYLERGVRIRTFEIIINRLVGGPRISDVFGPKHCNTVTVHTDGGLDVTDVVNAMDGWSSQGATRGHLAQGIGSIRSTERYRRFSEAARVLPEACMRCPIVRICGGGHVVSRWGKAKAFDQPSVYCADITSLVGHIWSRVAPTLRVEVPIALEA